MKIVDFKIVPKKEIKSSDNQNDEKNIVMPSTELLDRALDDGESLSENELNQIASLLETKLDEFGIEATVESVIPGPVVTTFGGSDFVSISIAIRRAFPKALKIVSTWW